MLTPLRPASLLLRTSATLGISALAIIAVSVITLDRFVTTPIAEQSADDVAALLVLTAQTWVELPPEARPYFGLELVESHGLVVSPDPLPLEPFAERQRWVEEAQARLDERLGTHVPLLQGDDLVWAEIPMGGQRLQIGFSPERRDIEPLSVALVIIGAGAAIVLVASLLIVQRITRPLDAVAKSAQRFRGGAQPEPLPESGPKELVALSRSFNHMARDISELMANRTTLLAGISHDLRTPLARMRLAVELLGDDADPQLVARVSRNVEEMDALLAQALQFARGLSVTEPERVVLRALFEEVLAGFDHDPLRLEWRAADGFEFDLDVAVFRRVLMNLVQNAIQYGSGEVVVTCKTKPDRLRIKVMDRGPGIPAADRDRIFQPFYRMERSRSTSTGGSGLGLAIVKQLCEARGWEVSVDARPGGGAVFVLELPRRAEP